MSKGYQRIRPFWLLQGPGQTERLDHNILLADLLRHIDEIGGRR